ncbi:protein kinase [Spirochaetia bacterium]|nr:protein kinase [Spirochaetia bacterium]
MQISIYDVQDKPLGQGGMGKVYLGTDNKGNFVAIKEMLAEFVTDADLRARFHQEVKISSQMEHPSIVKMYASFEENGNLYLVMEYVEGETIEHYVRHRGAIDESEAIRLMCGTLSALGYAHQKGFVHRDIKPSNIMIRPNGTICLLDFGIAKDMNSNGLTVGQATIGTDGYMSPEQAGGYNIDQRSDIYSLGCVLFYMLTGHHAIEKRSNDLETRMAIIQNDFPLLATYTHSTSVTVQTILNKATHKNMQMRFQSCFDFAVAFKRSASVTETAPAMNLNSEVNPFNKNSNGGETMLSNNNITISIGRENCCITIPNSKVSRHHADIKVETGSGYTKYFFVDHSSNGTAINGRRVHNTTTEIFPQNHPDIYLAGSVELNWNDIDAALRKMGVDNNATQIASGYTAPDNNSIALKKKLNTMALIGFILGLISLLLSFIGIVGILACVFSGLGLGKFNSAAENNKWMAIVGLILGGFGIILACIQLVQPL